MSKVLKAYYKSNPNNLSLLRLYPKVPLLRKPRSKPLKESDFELIIKLSQQSLQTTPKSQTIT